MDTDRLSQVKRVNVVGTSGSGKTTFGRRLAEAMGLPFHEMDHLYWKADWQEPTDEEFIPALRKITDADRWVLDGNYSRTNSVKWPRTQLVVWLDMSLQRTLYRVTTRSLRRAILRQECWAGTGNRESLKRSFFSTESVILWSLTSYRRNRRSYTSAMQSPDYGHLWFVRLTNPAECENFLSAAASSVAA